MVEAGKVMRHADPRHFKLSTAGEAYRALETGSAADKIVVDIDLSPASLLLHHQTAF
jgi:NADPH2:quinone reductase